MGRAANAWKQQQLDYISFRTYLHLSYIAYDVNSCTQQKKTMHLIDNLKVTGRR